jgi:hypothetical protein
MQLIQLFFDLVLHLDKHLSTIITQFGLWTYLLLFGIIFMETGLVVTPFLPGDSLLIRVVAGASPVFQVRVGVFKGPFPGFYGCVFVSFIARHKVELDQETDRARSVRLGLHSDGAVGIVRSVKAAVLILNIHEPIGGLSAEFPPGRPFVALPAHIQIRVQYGLYAVC